MIAIYKSFILDILPTVYLLCLLIFQIGYTWLELRPLTGRKHQLRVHCAEVLGTPIVGDYKYGWQSHRKWEPISVNWESGRSKRQKKQQQLPFGLDMESGTNE
ncbi:hypothetical protein ACLOJK_003791 [Asimina triloba]